MIIRTPEAIRKDQGYSLIEIMIGLAISAIVALIISSVITSISGITLNQADKLEAEGQLQEATYQIKKALSRAVNVTEYTAGSLNTYSPGSNAGKIIAYDGHTIATGSGSVSTIAVFNREVGASAGAIGTSLFAGTGLFYQKPTGSKSGVIYLDLGATAPTVAPTPTAFLIDRVVNFNVSNIQSIKNASGLSSVFSAQFQIAVRYFMGNDIDEKGGWCPPADIGVLPLCTKTAGYRDVEVNFQVSLVDNEIPTTGTSTVMQGSEGQIYFFRMLSPLEQQ